MLISKAIFLIVTRLFENYSVDSNAHAYYNTDSDIKLAMDSQKLVCFSVISVVYLTQLICLLGACGGTFG
jgi:hypothetical protein